MYIVYCMYRYICYNNVLEKIFIEETSDVFSQTDLYKLKTKWYWFLSTLINQSIDMTSN